MIPKTLKELFLNKEMTKMLSKRVDVPNINSEAHYNCTNSFFPYILTCCISIYVYTHFNKENVPFSKQNIMK